MKNNSLHKLDIHRIRRVHQHFAEFFEIQLIIFIQIKAKATLYKIVLVLRNWIRLSCWIFFSTSGCANLLRLYVLMLEGLLFCHDRVALEHTCKTFPTIFNSSPVPTWICYNRLFSGRSSIRSSKNKQVII